jgi:hypothetical protein
VKTQVRPGGRPNGASILFVGSSSAHWSGRLPRWCGEKRRQGGAYPAEGSYGSLTQGRLTVPPIMWGDAAAGGLAIRPQAFPFRRAVAGDDGEHASVNARLFSQPNS